MESVSESQRIICWRLILEEFVLNIYHIYGVDYILSDTLSNFSVYLAINPSSHNYGLVAR